MTIIIETTTTTRERLVLVPPGTCTDYVDKPGLVRLVTTDARDATPDDLARGGYVPVERAEKAEWSARVARMAMENELARLMRERDTLRAELARLTPVAARVRQECLVAQAVARNADFHVTECISNRWRVVVVDRDVNSKTELCAPSDVPATLARLLGEVSRG